MTEGEGILSSAPTNDDNRDLRTLFVRNLAYTTTVEKLEDLFSAIGPIRKCFLVAKKGSEHHQGLAYVTYSLAEDAARALSEVAGSILDKREVKIDYANKRLSWEERKKQRRGALSVADENDGENDKVTEMDKGKDSDKVKAIEKSAENDKVKEKDEGKESDKGNERDKGSKNAKEQKGVKGRERGNVRKGEKTAATMAREMLSKSARTVVIGVLNTPSGAGNKAQGSNPEKLESSNVKNSPLDSLCVDAIIKLLGSFGTKILAVQNPIPYDAYGKKGLFRDGCPFPCFSLELESVREAKRVVEKLHRKEINPSGDKGGNAKGKGGKEREGATAEKDGGHGSLGVSTSFKVWARQLGGEGSKVKRFRVIVRNIPFHATEDAILSFLSSAGFVWELTVLQNDKKNPNHINKGFAFAAFTCKGDAEKAVSSLNGKSIKGRAVAVDLSVSKKTFEEEEGEKEKEGAEEHDTEDEEEDDEEFDKEMEGEKEREEPKIREEAKEKKEKAKAKKEKAKEKREKKREAKRTGKGAEDASIERGEGGEAERGEDREGEGDGEREEEKEERENSPSVRDEKYMMKQVLSEFLKNTRGGTLTNGEESKDSKVASENPDAEGAMVQMSGAKAPKMKGGKGRGEGEEGEGRARVDERRDAREERKTGTTERAMERKTGKGEIGAGLADEKAGKEGGKERQGEKFDRSDKSSDCLVFARNLPSSFRVEKLRELFEKFGAVKACRPVLDPVTKAPRGTAFIEFSTPVEAKLCVQASEREERSERNLRNKTNNNKRDEFLNGEKGSLSFSLDGVRVKVAVPVDRERAKEISREREKEKEKSRRDNDKRNLYLLDEGSFPEGSPAFQLMSKHDIERRRRLKGEKETKLRSPNFVVSPVRLAVHNVPSEMSENSLKKLFLEAVRRRAKKQSPKIRQVKILREGERGAQQSGVLIKKSEKFKAGAQDGEEGGEGAVSEGSKNSVPRLALGKSKGIAFVEFSEHQHALAALREMNNNPKIFSFEKRPIVEFSIENKRVLDMRQKKLAQLPERKSGNSFAKKEKPVKSLKALHSGTSEGGEPNNTHVEKSINLGAGTKPSAPGRAESAEIVASRADAKKRKERGEKEVDKNAFKRAKNNAGKIDETQSEGGRRGEKGGGNVAATRGAERKKGLVSSSGGFNRGSETKKGKYQNDLVLESKRSRGRGGSERENGRSERHSKGGQERVDKLDELAEKYHRKVLGESAGVPVAASKRRHGGFQKSGAFKHRSAKGGSQHSGTAPGLSASKVSLGSIRTGPLDLKRWFQ